MDGVKLPDWHVPVPGRPGPHPAAQPAPGLPAGLGRGRALNSVGFVAVGFYTSHMTGITATVADQVTWGHREWLLIGALCFVMGQQNALITKVSDATIRTLT